MKPVLIILIVICIVFSAFFSGIEISYAKVNKQRLEREEENKIKGAKLANYFVTNYNETITTILVGNNLVNIASSSMATLLFVSLDPKNGELMATIVMTLVVLTFGEIIPKTVCSSFAYKMSIVFSPIMKFFRILFYPFTALVNKLLYRFNKNLENIEDPVITDDELQEMVDTMEEEGIIDEDTQELISNAIDFVDVDAFEIMIHRTDVYAYDINEPIDTLLSDPNLLDYSRIPVYDETIDNIIGILNTKQLIKLHLNGDEININDLITEPLYVFQTQSVADILTKFRKEHIHMAIVKDEFGGTLGILTIEDVIEELVGDIYDEKDKEEVEDDYRRVNDSKMVVNGEMNLYDFFELIGYDVTDEFDSPYTTVGGWVIDEIGHYPKVGEQFSFENYNIRVKKTTKFTVEKITVEKEEEKEQNITK